MTEQTNVVETSLAARRVCAAAVRLNLTADQVAVVSRHTVAACHAFTRGEHQHAFDLALVLVPIVPGAGMAFAHAIASGLADDDQPRCTVPIVDRETQTVAGVCGGATRAIEHGGCWKYRCIRCGALHDVVDLQEQNDAAA